MSQPSRSGLLAVGVTRRYRPGSIAMAEGQRSREVLVIHNGWLDVTKGTVDGRELVIAQRGAGDLVGELSAIDRLPRTASVRATTPVEVTAIPSHTFLDRVGDDRELASALLTHLAARVRQASAGLLQLGVVDGASRVCRHIITLVDRKSPANRSASSPVEVAIGSQEHLGLVVGLHRSSLVKILSELRQLGVIRTGRGSITILDQQRLRELAAVEAAD